jgi:hypothetical protein
MGPRARTSPTVDHGCRTARKSSVKILKLNDKLHSLGVG